MVLFASALLVMSSCSKDDDNNSSTTAATNAFAGNWTLSKYDGMAITSPMYGTCANAASTATLGTTAFVVSFDGSATNKENDAYVLSSSNTKVNFTKTDGNYTVLSGGGTWTINTLDAHSLKMTSQYGLIIEMTK